MFQWIKCLNQQLAALNRRRLTARRANQARIRNASYIKNGAATGSPSHNTSDRFMSTWEAHHKPGPYFEPKQSDPAPKGSLHLVCFYLPQFHAIPENDEWWGEGFTEWRNVARAIPRFAGHDQPRTPRDLGHYNLDHPDVMEKQVELARQAGITGFSFYYYNFDGRRILERPLEAFLKNAQIDMPFCLTWANENWTRRWDGLADDVLLAQTYGSDNEIALVDDLCRHFADGRYIRIDNRPVFILYRPGLVPNTTIWIQRFRDLCLERHGENPYIMMVQGFGSDDPRTFGLDGAVEFPPHKLTQGLQPKMDLELFDPDFSGVYYRYDDLVDASLMVPTPEFDLVKCVAPGWDNEARRPGRGTGFIGATPDAYERWLSGALAYAHAHPVAGSAQVVFINAWNEWAEGAYLEPDVHCGHAYLNATRRARSAWT